MDRLLMITLMMVPFFLLAFGLLWRILPPKQINKLYGYRHPRKPGILPTGTVEAC
ncbi:hypothetical protein [Amphibacillus marinus]|uniref:hypothetical protein n=1 Tax=Amphibacillus marinus TaxID=872970 RepID=UPI0015A5D1F1|nr:hypothetical protein [Amphibacillus marinus]